jgi:hypothetical protein
MQMFLAAFLYLLTVRIFWANNIGEKAVSKMLVKLTLFKPSPLPDLAYPLPQGSQTRDALGMLVPRISRVYTRI